VSFRLNFVLVCAIALGSSGCSGIPIRSGETTHYVIVGIGVVSIPSAAEQTDVRVSRMHVLGLSLVDQPGLRFALGYASGTAVAVPADAEDVRVEVSQRPFGELRVHANETGPTPPRFLEPRN
jgi:hypothetical protein